ncbi:VOC family protein [bacterium]|nr:VOC family protein [bacterium]
MSMEYKGDVTLTFGVKNLDAAIKWYEETLGFKLLYKLDDIGWGELQGPDEKISVGLGVREEVQQGGGCVPVWGVKDIAAARSELESKAVRFDGDTSEIPEMVKLATFFDPDGNAMMLVESLTQG